MKTLRISFFCVAAVMVALALGTPLAAGDKEDAALLVSGKKWEQFFKLYGKPFVFKADGTYTRGDAKKAGNWSVKNGKLTLTGSFLNTRTFKTDTTRTFGIEWLDKGKLGFWLSEPGKKRSDGYFGANAFMKSGVNIFAKSGQSDDDRIEKGYIKQWGQQLHERAATLRVKTLAEYQRERRSAKPDKGRSNAKIGLVVLTERGFGTSSAYFLDGKLVCLEQDYVLFVFKTPTLATSLAKAVDETLKRGVYVAGIAMTKPEGKKVRESDSHFFKKYVVKQGRQTTSIRVVVEFRTLKEASNRFRTAQIRLWDETAADAIKNKLGKGR